MLGERTYEGPREIVTDKVRKLGGGLRGKNPSAVAVLRLPLGCLDSRRTHKHPGVHVQSQIMAILSPQDLLKSVVRFDPRLPQILPSQTDRCDRRNLVWEQDGLRSRL